jgi:sugar phosphate isomerase/epimerase
MLRLSINEMTTFRWSFEEDVHHYVAAGISGIGVWRQKLSDFGEEKGVELIREKDLAVSSLLWAGGFTGSDGRSFKESVSDAHEAIRLAAALRASCLTVYSGARGGHTNNHARRLFKTALKELVPVAGEFGVTLAIEPMHVGYASEWTFLTSVQETLSLIEELANPQLKIAFDTYQFGWEPLVLESLASWAPHIAIVQLGDTREMPQREPNRCRIGEGLVPLSKIIEELRNAGYGGFFEVKLLGEDVEAYSYDELVEHSKQTFDSWSHSAQKCEG